jgi:Recombinase
VRGVWLWLREHGLKFPLPNNRFDSFTEPMRWVEPTYHAVHKVLTHPAYAGAYVFGKTRYERYLGQDGAMHVRRRKLPRDQWQVLINDHHPGYLDWDTYQANRSAIATNTRPRAHEPGTGAVREGCAWLQGLATCGICGRRLAVFYEGPTKATPGYYCTAGGLVNGRRGVPPAHRGADDPTRGRRCLPGRASAGRGAGLPGRRPAPGRRPRRRPGPVAA